MEMQILPILEDLLVKRYHWFINGLCFKKIEGFSMVHIPTNHGFPGFVGITMPHLLACTPQLQPIGWEKNTTCHP
jgi:hypothetical protein